MQLSRLHKRIWFVCARENWFQLKLNVYVAASGKLHESSDGVSCCDCELEISTLPPSTNSGISQGLLDLIKWFRFSPRLRRLIIQTQTLFSSRAMSAAHQFKQLCASNYSRQPRCGGKTHDLYVMSACQKSPSGLCSPLLLLFRPPLPPSNTQNMAEA